MTATTLHDTRSARAMPQLVICLTRKVEQDFVGEWMVERIIAQADGVKKFLSFDRPDQAGDMLCKEFWDGLRSYLPRKSERHCAVAADAQIETSQALLRGLSVSSHAPKQMVQRAMVNIRTVFGTLQGIFAQGRFPGFLREVDCRLATLALQDILLPALNLLEYDEKNQGRDSDRALDFLEKLKRDRDGLLFYTNLLTRHVSARSKRVAPETARTLDWPQAS